MSFKIIVDSCCDLTSALLHNSAFRKVPLTIQVGPHTFVDDDTFHQANLLWRMKESEEAPQDLLPLPRRLSGCLYRAGADDIYVVTLSALLSGSHNSAAQARLMFLEDHPGVHIHIFNSCSASSGEVLVALKVLELAQAGLDFNAVVQQTSRFVRKWRPCSCWRPWTTCRKNGRLTRLQSLGHRDAEDQAAHGRRAGGGDLQARAGPVHEAGPLQDGGADGQGPGP